METKMTGHSPIFVVLGRDAQGKPHASRFADADVERAAKAAEMMGYHALQVEDPSLRGIAANLPLGKAYATGRLFVPFTKAEIFDKLAALLEDGGNNAADFGQAHAATPATDEPVATDPAGITSEPEGQSEFEEPRPRFLPRDWDEVGTGSLVLAHDPEAEAWYEAVVHA